jgi:NAD+ synthase (glutamine-hydrolysing)
VGRAGAHPERAGRATSEGLEPTADNVDEETTILLDGDGSVTAWPRWCSLTTELVFRESFRAASRATVDKLATDLAANGLGDIAVMVGYLDEDGGPHKAATLYLDERAGPRNAAAFCLGRRFVRFRVYPVPGPVACLPG